MEYRLINSIKILYLNDDIILSGSDKFDKHLTELISTEDKKVILNFSEVNFINSNILGSILKLYKTLKNKNGQVVLADFNDDISRLFKITKIDNVIPIFQNENEAVNYLNNN